MDIVNPPRAHFFSLPFELRQRIFYLAIRAHAGVYGISTRESNDAGKKRPDVRFSPAPHERPMGRRFARCYFWGSEEYAKIFPISHQWYFEIQQTLYSSFTFEICTTSLVHRCRTSFCLGFLPTQVLPLIRHVELLISLDKWTSSFDRDEAMIIVQGHQEIFAQLTGLRSVIIDIGDVRYQYISRNIRAQFLDWILDIARPFIAVPHFELVCPHNRYDRVEGLEGIPYELVVRDCIEILLDEIKFRTEGIGNLNS